MLSKSELVKLCCEFLDSNGYKGEYYKDILRVKMPEDMSAEEDGSDESSSEYFYREKKAMVSFKTIFADDTHPDSEIRAPVFILFINYETGEIDGRPGEM